MTDRFDHSWESDEGEADEAGSGRGWLARILIVALLAGTGSGLALLWRAAGAGSLQSLMPQAGAAASVADKSALPGELDAIRQQITGLNQSTQQLLSAQQAEIKRLSEQVNVLSGKLDLLQRPVTSAQAAIPPVKPPAPPVVARKKPEPAKPLASLKPEPKPVDTRPTGAISTGGAPLQLTR